MSDSDVPLKLPVGASDIPAQMPLPMSDKPQRPDTGEAVLPNPYAGKEKLTPREAIDCINWLSAELLQYDRSR